MRNLFFVFFLILNTFTGKAQIRVAQYNWVTSTNNIPYSIRAELNQNTNKVILTISGSNQHWFAVGFDTSFMTSTTNAAIYTGDENNITDYLLQAPIKNIGQNLGSFWTTTSSTTNGSNIVYTFERDFDISSSCASCYTFDPLISSLPIILAVGNNLNLGYHGEDYRSAILNFNTLAISKIALSSQQPLFYPNPATSFITINSAKEISKIKIYNLLGKEIKSINYTELNSNKIFVDDITKGVYIINFLLQNGAINSSKMLIL